MGARPLFSVITPAFNAERRIAETVGSVLVQSERDLELILVDDGSSDETVARARELAAADPRVLVISRSNEGTTAARNAGLARASGRFVSFLDDDDLWLPGYLEAVRPLLEQPGVGLVHTDALVVDFDDGSAAPRTAWERFALPIRRQPLRLAPADAEAALLRVNFVTTCATTVSAEALEAAGGLDPEITGADDWDLWLRIAGAGFALAGVPETLVRLRKRRDSLGSDPAMMAAGALQTLRKARARGALTARAERIAARHERLVELELRALSSRARLPARLAGAARRLGRKRLT